MSSSDSFDTLLGTLIAKRYRITTRIGSGVYGVVYEAVDKNRNVYAVKLEEVDPDSRLRHEHHVYQSLHTPNTLVGIPRIYYYEQNVEYFCLVMEKLGGCIGDDPNRRQNCLTVENTMLAGRDAMRILKDIHTRGFLHLDLKPSNIVYNANSSRLFVSILDFGLAERYVPRIGAHRSQRDDHSVSGPFLYASRNTHAHRTRSRKDDLEMLAYSLIRVCRGTLPWEPRSYMPVLSTGTGQSADTRYEERDQRLFDHIGHMKKTMREEDICAGMPDEMRQYLVYVNSLGYDDTPDYKHMEGLFDVAFQRHLSVCSSQSSFYR